MEKDSEGKVGSPCVEEEIQGTLERGKDCMGRRELDDLCKDSLGVHGSVALSRFTMSRF